MTLKELLGSDYREDMTLADIDKAISSKKLVDLAGGKYVDAEKYNRLNDEYKASKTAHDELLAKTKDYDDLAKFKADAETKAQKDELRGKLKEAGFKDEFLDYAMFQVDNGTIVNDDKIIDNAKAFLESNKQYGQEVAPQPGKVEVTLPKGSSGKSDEYQPPEIGERHPWNV